MLGRLAKSAAAPILTWSGAGALVGRMTGGRGQPLILTYHRVVEDFEESARSSMPAMLISARTIERHLDWLGSRYRMISLNDIGREMEGRRRPGRPAAAVTFDDGYADFRDVALPILERKGIPSALFVVTDLIGTARAQTHDMLHELLAGFLTSRPDPEPRLARILSELEMPPEEAASLISRCTSPAMATPVLLNGLPRSKVAPLIRALALEARREPGMEALPGHRALGWEGLRDVSRRGVVVGSHTLSHSILADEDSATIALETLGSRRRLEEALCSRVLHFAYPAGRFDPVAAAVVASSGYSYAYTTCRHRDAAHPLHTIPRVVLWEKSCLDALGRFSPSLMSCQVNRAFEIRSRCRHDRRPPARLPALARVQVETRREAL